MALITDIPAVSFIDASSIIYPAVKTDLGSVVFDTNPPVPLFNACQKIIRDVKSKISFQQDEAIS